MNAALLPSLTACLIECVISRPQTSSSQLPISSRPCSTRAEPGGESLSTIVTVASGAYIDS